MDSPELRRQTVSALAEVARRPGIRVLQVDFDATRSEREFYAAVLRGLRPEMPHDMPLSITALLSWCAATGVGDADWMAGLPVDEAVPMFFRLGGSARPFADKSWVPVRENLCRSSVGISTDESWPEMNSQVQRVYLFSPRPWTPAQLDAVSETPFGERDASLLVHNAALDAAGTGLRERVAVGPIIRNDSEELR